MTKFTTLSTSVSSRYSFPIFTISNGRHKVSTVWAINLKLVPLNQ